MLGLSGSPLRKPYSIASAPWEVTKSGIMQVLVQVEDSGGLDPHLELASPGTMLDLEGPFGSFGLPAALEQSAAVCRGRHRHRAAALDVDRARVAAHEISSRAHLQRPSVDEFAFRPELAALESAGRIASYFTVTREESSGWQGRRGRISEALLTEALPSTESTCLVCGPPQLVNDTRHY